jgi:hypothetical protein
MVDAMFAVDRHLTNILGPVPGNQGRVLTRA